MTCMGATGSAESPFWMNQNRLKSPCNKQAGDLVTGDGSSLKPLVNRNYYLKISILVRLKRTLVNLSQGLGFSAGGLPRTRVRRRQIATIHHEIRNPLARQHAYDPFD